MNAYLAFQNITGEVSDKDDEKNTAPAFVPDSLVWITGCGGPKLYDMEW